MTDESKAADPAPTDGVKPGHQTTEFKIHLAVVILGALATIAGIVESVVKGTISSVDAMMAIGGVVAATMNALGYTASRTIVKKSAAVILVVGLLLFGLAAGCSSPSPDPDHGVSNASYRQAITKAQSNMAGVLEKMQAIKEAEAGDRVLPHSVAWWDAQIGLLSDTATLLSNVLAGAQK